MEPLSVVLPVYDELRRIDAGLAGLRTLASAWEGPVTAIFVDDGSTDGTADALEARLATLRQTGEGPNCEVHVVRRAHAGKGAALRAGAAHTGSADWVLFTDVDWSVPPREVLRLYEVARSRQADVVIATREGLGARRVGEPIWRHLVGRAFNTLVQSWVLAGHPDTQCGFKLLRGEAARDLFAKTTLDGWAIDVELLVLAHAEGLRVEEVPVSWRYEPDSRVRVLGDALGTAREVWAVRWRWRTGAVGRR